MWIGKSEQVRLIDRLSAEKYNIPFRQLMQNAGNAVCDDLIDDILPGDRVCVLCGKGNNAGDGFVLALVLQKRGIDVTLSLVCGTEFSDDAAFFFARCKEQNIDIRQDVAPAEIYVEAVFGTGFHGELPEIAAKAFQKVNASGSYKVAIDVPGGVNCDTGAAAENAFEADKTVTFEILKYCHVLPECARFVGKVSVRNIGLAEKAFEDAFLTVSLLDNCSLPKRNGLMHKGSAGTLLCVVGCQKYQGAAALSVEAAARSGCGIVVGAVPESAYLPVACKTENAVLFACPENAEHCFAATAADMLLQIIKERRPDAVLFGSGIGLADTHKEIMDVLWNTDIPLIVDGDGLRYLPRQNRTAPLILTPHLGEFCRLTDTDVDSLRQDRMSLSLKFATERNAIVVLKDAMTVISAPDGRQWVLSAPNSGLAKGGSGDVLAGMISSFAAQGLCPVDAARAGVLFHSKAAGYAADSLGEYAMLPSDIIRHFPKALK